MKKYFFFAILLLLMNCESDHKQQPVKATLVSQKSMTASEVVNRIKENVNCDWREKTVDTFKGGSPDAPVTGIATTFLANMAVLKKAKAQGLNLIITHEPTYYNHLDETEQFEGDQVYQDKKQYIEDNGLIVWRFHDHWHYTAPDGIHKGMVKDLGWENYQLQTEELIFDFPETTVADLAGQLKNHYKTNAIRVVGDPELTSSKIGLVVGSPGSMAHIKMLQTGKVDILVIGEVNEWETVEYVRDAIGQGKKMALILLGHANSEEAGMQYCAEWLKTFITEAPIKHIPAGDPFWVPE